MTNSTRNTIRPSSRANWNSPTVLRDEHRSIGQNYLDVPWTNESFSYAETLEAAERVGPNKCWRLGDRVLIMILTVPPISCLAGSSVGGLVEVPINTAYRGIPRSSSLNNNSIDCGSFSRVCRQNT